MQGDLHAPVDLDVFFLGDRIARAPVGFPAPDFIFSGLARNDLDLVRRHKARIKTHAELADEVERSFVAARILHGLDHRRRARPRDRAEILDQLLAVHADAVVGDGQGIVVGIFDGAFEQALVKYEGVK